MGLAVKCEAEYREDRCLHRLERLDPKRDDGFRYCCRVCGKYLYRLNGIVVGTKSYPEKPPSTV